MKLNKIFALILLVFYLIISSCLKKEPFPNNSEILRFARLDKTDPEKIKKETLPLIQYLQKELKIKTELVVFKTEDELIQQMKLGKIDFSWVSSPLHSKEIEHGSTAFIQIIKNKYSDLDKGLIIAKKGNKISRLEDLKGKKFGYFPQDSSTIYLFSRLLLLNKGINPDKFFEKTIEINNYSEIINDINSGKIDSGLVSESFYQIHVVKSKYNIIAETEEIPNEPIIYYENLRPNFSNNNKSSGGKISYYPAEFHGIKPSELTNAFLKLSRNSNHRNILDSLKIKGFHKINNNTYKKVSRYVDFMNNKLKQMLPLNKDKIIFLGRIQYMNKPHLKKMYSPLLNYLKKELNVKGVILKVPKYADLTKKITDGKIDIGWYATLEYPEAVKRGIIPLVQPVRFGKPTNNSIIIVRKNSRIFTPSDLKGKSIALGDKSSASSYFYPMIYFIKKGIVPNKFFKNILPDEKHDKIIDLVLKGTVDAGATNDAALMENKNLNTEGNIRIIATISTIPEPPLACSKDLDSDLRNRLKKSLLKLDSKTNKNILDSAKIDRFIEPKPETYIQLEKDIAKYQRKINLIEIKK